MIDLDLISATPSRINVSLTATLAGIVCRVGVGPNAGDPLAQFGTERAFLNLSLALAGLEELVTGEIERIVKVAGKDR